MNAKFFDVKKAKQDAIINAALKVFLANGYKKASTDVIVQEAGISKGLLFHYFISKKGLYEFICDYSVKYMTMELTRAVNKSEKDFFKVQVQVERAKTRVMKNYPYMQQFLNSLKFEKNADALEAIGNKCEQLEETYNAIYCQTDNTRFLDKIDVNKIIDMISWMSDGFVRDKFRNPKPDLDEMNEEFEKYLNMLRRHFYRSANDDMVSIAREESVERDDTVMEEMRQIVSFEEQLLSSKISVVKSDDKVENVAATEMAETESELEPVKPIAPVVEEDVKNQQLETDALETVNDADDETVETVAISVSAGTIPVMSSPIKLWSEPEEDNDKGEGPANEVEPDVVSKETEELKAESEVEAETEVKPEAETDEKPEIIVAASKPISVTETEDEQTKIEKAEAAEAKPKIIEAENTILNADDEIAFPSWWTNTIPSAGETGSANDINDTVEDNISSYGENFSDNYNDNYSESAPTDNFEQRDADQPVVFTNTVQNSGSNGSSFGHYVDDALEAEYVAGGTVSAPSDTAADFAQLMSGAVEAVNTTIPIPGVPENTPIMAMPVPDDILKTTYNNPDDDDDEPWTPRPVKQILL